LTTCSLESEAMLAPNSDTRRRSSASRRDVCGRAVCEIGGSGNVGRQMMTDSELATYSIVRCSLESFCATVRETSSWMA